MDYATNFAVVENGIVVNIAWGMVYGTASDSVVQIDDLAVHIGDTYVDGVFYHDGERVLTMQEQMEDMQAALELLGVTNNG